MRLALAVAFLLSFPLPLLAQWEAPRGTSKEELAALNLREPGSVSVLVLPFRHASEDRRKSRLVTSAVATLLFNCNYRLGESLNVPNSPEALGELLANQEVARPKPASLLEEPVLGLEDLLRIGKEEGADLVVCGEIRDLHTYRKAGLFSAVKKGVADIILRVADVKEGRYVLERRYLDSGSLGGGAASNLFGVFPEAQFLEVGIAIRCLQAMLKDWCAALPPHRHRVRIPLPEAVGNCAEAWEKRVKAPRP